MLDSVRQVAPQIPVQQPLPPRVSTTGAAPYVAGWNPPAPTPAPAPVAAPPPPAESGGFFGRLGSAITSGDVRGVASTLRDGIGDAAEAGKDGITGAVSFTGETIGRGADFARSHVTGDDFVSQGLRGAISTVESTTRFSVGVTGGVLREGVGLVGSVGQLGVTLAETQVSAEARQELGESVVGAVGAAGEYVSAGIRDPGKVGSDLNGAWNATTDFAGRTADRYGQALAEGRTEEIGMDVGAVATYVMPVGGGPARALLGAGARATTEGVVRGGTTLAAREGGEAIAASVAREAAPGVTRQAANDVGPALRAANDIAPPVVPNGRPTIVPDVPPSPLHARAQMAEYVYGRGELPVGTTKVADAAELRRLNLTPQMLDRGAFHAEVYRSGEAGAEAYTIAFRGSGGRAGDWVSNGLQGVGLPSNHYARALEIGRAISRTDASIPVEFVGHSLGGGLASHAANAAGREATTFNAAGLHFISQAQGRAVAAEAGVGRATVDNYAVPGEFLTTAQHHLSPLVPRAFGTTHALPGIAPEGAGFLAQYGPLAPINRHMMDWVLASTAGR
ncbi:hypothetical protein ASG29_02340 [Sphingomonas sp. Leaf412]|uniref:hypothetical protein n=1 Tax=Sphingomonas sp. Leaf412 TaxID=1736370 RepID=UPI0006F2E24C|nr:hypothetical protein [Sphingomonas sp. Leaf412]KQT34995.1 hypothetical protein ASG29_02340 [Sphingomonas sp. Leaf412]